MGVFIDFYCLYLILLLLCGDNHIAVFNAAPSSTMFKIRFKSKVNYKINVERILF